MKYFNPSYWFKLWVLSAPLFNDKTQGINAKSIDNKKIKDWVSNNTSLESINQEINFTKSSNNYQPYSLNETNQNINPIYQTELETSTHKHRHKKSRRIKKQVTPHPRPSKEILQLNEKLIINENNRREYQTSFQTVINELVTNNILYAVFDNTNNNNMNQENSQIFTLNTRNYGYFRIPVGIRGEQDGQSFSRNLELVFRTDNLYVQGFIVNNNYYHFDFRNIDMNRQPATVRDGSVPLLTQIEGMTNRELTGISPDYRDLWPERNRRVGWSEIFNSFNWLANNNNLISENNRSINSMTASSLGEVILLTAEAMRFRNIYSLIINNLIVNNGFITLGRNTRTEQIAGDEYDGRYGIGSIDNVYSILINWGSYSGGRFREFLGLRWLLETYNRMTNQNLPSIERTNRGESFNLSIEDITWNLQSNHLRILLGFINVNINRRNANCRRGRRDITNKFWHEKFCDLKPQIDKIQGKITAIKILDENTKSGNLKAGTIYVGTENGVYIIYPDGQVHRFDNLDFSIKDIILDGNGSAYVTNDNCEIYHLNLVGWGSEKLENMESCDLNKELKIYYDNSKNDREFSKTYTGDGKISIPIVRILEGAGMGGGVGAVAGAIVGSAIPGAGTVIGAAGAGAIGATIGTGTAWLTFGDYINNKNQESKDFYINLKEVNPFDYKKIEILYENFDNIYTKASRGDEKFYSEKITNCIKGNIKSEFNCKLMDITERNFYSLQNFKLKFYKNITDWKLQIHKTQFAKNNAWLFANNGGMWMGVGKGIRLYNDDDTFETQIPNSNDRKRREIFEEKNITKWTDEFRKNINYEQHLSIDNKTNFVTNNITSL